MIYVRWRKGEDRRGRIFPTAGSVSVGALPCPLCAVPLAADLSIQLVAVGPDPDSPEAVRKHDEGRWHTAMAVAMHAGCVADLSDAELEVLISELEVVRTDV
jgi:hypothetical protein